MKNIKIELKWALIFIVMMLAWMLLEKLAGLHSENISKHATYSSFVAIPAVAIYILALLDKKKNYYGGEMTYRQSFKAGLVLTLIIAVLTPLLQVITSEVITPEFFPNMIKYTVSEGKMTLPEAENFFSLKSYIMQSMIGALIMGILTTAIVSLFVRTKASNESK
jgi:hypothetical protein